MRDIKLKDCLNGLEDAPELFCELMKSLMKGFQYLYSPKLARLLVHLHNLKCIFSRTVTSLKHFMNIWDLGSSCMDMYDFIRNSKMHAVQQSVIDKQGSFLKVSQFPF